MRNLILILILSFGLVACGGEEKPKGHTHGPGGHTHGEEAKAAADHGTAVDLGIVTIAGHQFLITRLGEVKPGKEAAFAVSLAGPSKDVAMTKLSVFLWLESKAGDRISPAAKGKIEAKKWHIHAMPRSGDGDPYRVVLRVRFGDKDERAWLLLTAHGQEHGPSHGHGHEHGR